MFINLDDMEYLQKYIDSVFWMVPESEKIEE